MTDASHFHGFANVHNLMRYSLLGDVGSTNGFLSLSSFFLVFTCEKFSGILYFKFLAGNQVLFTELRLAYCLHFGFMGFVES